MLETDDVFGRVLASLERHGVADDTLVVFASDNGCAHYTGAAETAVASGGGKAILPLL